MYFLKNCFVFSLVHFALSFSSQNSLHGQDASIRDFEERMEILGLVVSQMEANYERLNTWKGKYLVEDLSTIDGAYGELFKESSTNQISLPIQQSTSAEMEFAVSVPEDSIFTTMESKSLPRFTEVSSGKELKFSVGMFQQRSIVTGEHYLFLKPNQVHGQLNDFPAMLLPEGGGAAAFRQEVDESKGLQSAHVVDPRLLFGIDGKRIWEFLRVWTEWLERKPHHRDQLDDMIEVRREGDVKQPVYVISITRGKQPNELRTVFTCDANVGFNVSKYTEEVVPGRIRRSCQWQHRKEGRVYVPEFIENLQYDEDGETIRSRRSMRLVESSINVPLDKEQFSYRALGLARGDRVVDKIKGALFVFDGDKLVAPSDWKLSVDEPLERSIPFLLAINLILVIFLGGVYFVLSYRKKHGSSVGR